MIAHSELIHKLGSYNSSFFSTVGANIYQPYTAQGPDIQDIPKSNGTFDWDCTSSLINSFGSCPEPNAQWEVLSASDCIQAYAVDFLPNRGDVILVTNSSANDARILLSGSPGPGYGVQSEFSPYEWICSGTIDGSQSPCIEDWRKIDPATWTVGPWEVVSTSPESGEQWPVSYCLSETLPPRCQLQFDLPLLIIVIIFNVGKVVCITIVATRMKDHPLVTVGDAIASFVENPDPQTKDMCLITQQHYEDYSKIHRLITSCTTMRSTIQCSATIQSTIHYSQQRVRWMSTASRRHWMTTGVL